MFGNVWARIHLRFGAFTCYACLSDLGTDGDALDAAVTAVPAGLWSKRWIGG